MEEEIQSCTRMGWEYIASSQRFIFFCQCLECKKVTSVGITAETMSEARINVTIETERQAFTRMRHGCEHWGNNIPEYKPGMFTRKEIQRLHELLYERRSKRLEQSRSSGTLQQG